MMYAAVDDQRGLSGGQSSRSEEALTLLQSALDIVRPSAGRNLSGLAERGTS